MPNNRNRNELVVPTARTAIENLKNEIASEFGISNYDEIDKGSIPARIHGLMGGTMSKRLIEMGQLYLAGEDPKKSNLPIMEYKAQAIADVEEEPPWQDVMKD